MRLENGDESGGGREGGWVCGVKRRGRYGGGDVA